MLPAACSSAANTRCSPSRAKLPPPPPPPGCLLVHLRNESLATLVDTLPATGAAEAAGAEAGGSGGADVTVIVGCVVGGARVIMRHAA